MTDYICPKCKKDLGRIADKLCGDDEFGRQALYRFHEQLHWRNEQERWHELLEAARQLVFHNRAMAELTGLPRLAAAVEALKEIP